MRENSLNVSFSKGDTYIFEEEIESPRWAGVLYSLKFEKKVSKFLSFPQRKKLRLKALGTWRKLMNP